MSMLEIGRFLEKSELANVLSRSEQVQLASLLEEVHLLPDDMLFRQNDFGDGLYMIVSGDVEVLIEPERGNELVITLLSEGDMLGEFTLLEPAARSASAIARSRSVLYYLSSKRFELWKDAYHPVAYKLLRHLSKLACERLRQVNEQIALQFLDTEDILIRQEEDEETESVPKKSCLLTAAQSLFQRKERV